MQVKGPQRCTLSILVAQKIIDCSTCLLVPCSPTFKTVVPLLNVVGYTSISPESVSNSMLLELNRDGRKGVWERDRGWLVKTNVRGVPQEYGVGAHTVSAGSA